MAVKPKLCMIPSGYKGGASSGDLYSVLPSDGVGDFDFSRSGNATRINKDGLIETVSSNVPRLNYPLIDGVVQGCPSLLLENESRNLVQYSEDFSQSSWGKFFTTQQSNQVISPDGTQNADALFETTDNNFHISYDTITSLADTEYNFSIFVKKLNRRYVGIQGFYSSTRGNIAFFDLDNGVLEYTFSEGTGYSVSDAKIEEYPNGWYRLSANFIAPDTEIYMGLCLADERWSSGTAYDNVYTGDITKGVYLWGAQLEQSSFPTSYIPNFGTALGVTRSAETCNNSGDANTFNDSEGVLMAEISALNDIGSFENLSLSNGTNLSRVFLFYRNSLNFLEFRVTVNNSIQMQFQYTIEDAKTFNKMLIKYKENDFAVWINGFEIHTDNSGITFNSYPLNNLSFDNGQVSAPTSPFYGNTKQIQYFDTALTDTDLEELTSWQSFNEMAESQLYSIQ